MAKSQLTIADIPNEILVSTLSTFHTHDLLPLTSISHRFHNIILRILHYRLLLAASDPAYKIILEAYFPSRRYTRPYLFCTYLGTDGLSSQLEGKGSLYEDLDEKGDSVCGRLGRLSGLYSRFRPELPGVEGKMPVRRIAGAAPNLQSNTAGMNLDWFRPPESAAEMGSRVTIVAGGVSVQNNQQNDIVNTEGTAQGVTSQQIPQSQPIWANRGDGGNRKVVYTFNIDADELFSQFCAIATLVQLGPRRGVFLSYVPLVEDRQGVIRVWRQWLLDRAQELINEENSGVAKDIDLTKTPTNSTSADILQDKNILWTNYKRNVGLKLAVRPQQLNSSNSQYVFENCDDVPLTFDVEIRGKIS